MDTYNQTIQTVQSVQSYVYKISISVIILLVGFVIGLLAKKVVFRILREIELNKMMNRMGMGHDWERWISSLISYGIYLFTILVFLGQVGIRYIILFYVLLGVIIILLVLTAGVGLKDIAPNLVGWLFIKNEDGFTPGKKMEINNMQGVIERVGYLETKIKTERGDILYIPNSLFLKHKVKVRI